MTTKSLAFTGLVLIGLGLGTLLVANFTRLHRPVERVTETPVEVVGISPSGPGEWWVSRDAVAQGADPGGPFVARLKHLRSERLGIAVVRSADDRLLIGTLELNGGDSLILAPETIPADRAVSVRSGLDDEQLIQMTLEAGIDAGMAEDLRESVRFLSATYRDANGFDAHLMGRLLERAFKEFHSPRITLVENPAIQIEGNSAMVDAKVKLDATYRGRRNYLLGDAAAPNRVLILLEKSGFSWKVSSIQGLNPLGFDQKFLRLLGAEVGLPLSREEREAKKEACMPAGRGWPNVSALSPSSPHPSPTQ